MKIVICGDFFIKKKIYGSMKNIIDDNIKQYLCESNYNILNLEAPITKKTKKINKHGPNLKMNPCIVNDLSTLNINAVNLANNHLYDYGEDGVYDTLKTLEDNKINFFGVNISGKKYEYIDLFIENKKILVLSFSENDFGNIKNNTGNIKFDPAKSLDVIKHYKQLCDFLIVLFHSGRELCFYPSPIQNEISKQIIDNGADMLIYQHSHCISQAIEYHGKKIIFGQGDFFFDNRKVIDHGILVEIIVDNDNLNVNIVPFVKKNNTLSALKNISYNEYINNSKEMISLSTYSYKKKEFDFFCGERIWYYLSKISKMPKIIRYIDRKYFNYSLIKLIIGKKYLAMLYEFFYSNTHNEIILTGLKNEIEKRNK